MTSKAFGLAQLGNAYNDGALGSRNKIINGAMVIDQRNAGAAVTVNTASDTYAVDRFPATASGGGVFSLQRSTTAPSGFTNSLLATITTADASIAAADYYGIQHKIEGFNVADLDFGAASALAVTLSFRVRSSVTGTFCVSIGNGANDRWYPATYTINAANTFETKTIVVPGDVTGTWNKLNGTGLWLWFDLGSGSNYEGTANTWAGSTKLTVSGAANIIATNGATFYITGVQLEAGDTATPFEHRSYGQELALCQRYYQQVLPALALYMADYAGVARGYTVFPVQMRAAPSLTFIGQTFTYANATQTAALYSVASPAYIPQIKMNAEL